MEVVLMLTIYIPLWLNIKKEVDKSNDNGTGNHLHSTLIKYKVASVSIVILFSLAFTFHSD